MNVRRFVIVTPGVGCALAWNEKRQHVDHVGHHSEAKRWKTRAGAEAFLAKHRMAADNSKVVEV